MRASFLITVGATIILATSQTIIDDGTLWSDDYDITTSGWTMTSNDATAPAMTESTAITYHGSYTGASSVGEKLFTLSRAFQCEQPSIVRIWYTLVSCGTETDADYVSLAVNSNIHQTTYGVPTESFSDNYIETLYSCNVAPGWKQISYGPFEDETESDDSFTVSFTFRVDHNSDHFLVYDTKVECDSNIYTTISLSAAWTDDASFSIGAWEATPAPETITVPTSGLGVNAIHHGPYNSVGGIHTISRDFYCNHTSSVYLTYIVYKCGSLETEDYINLYLDDVLQSSSSFIGSDSGTAFTQTELKDAANSCNTWRRFPVTANENGINLIPYHTLFNVKFQMYVTATSEWWVIRDINVVCVANPTAAPTAQPTAAPTNVPTTATLNPSLHPTTYEPSMPSLSPTKPPSYPTNKPTNPPTGIPTIPPTNPPTGIPSIPPTINPSVSPTNVPSESPTKYPTKYPTQYPTQVPTNAPTKSPTRNPTVNPSKSPTKSPSNNPSANPTPSPTRQQDAQKDDNIETTQDTDDHYETKDDGAKDEDVEDILTDFVQNSTNVLVLVIGGGLFVIAVFIFCVINCKLRRNKAIAKQIAEAMASDLKNVQQETDDKRDGAANTRNKSNPSRHGTAATRSEATNSGNTVNSQASVALPTGTMMTLQTSTNNANASTMNNMFGMNNQEFGQVWSMSMTASLAMSGMNNMHMNQNSANAMLGPTLDNMNAVNNVLMGDIMDDLNKKENEIVDEDGVTCGGPHTELVTSGSFDDDETFMEEGTNSSEKYAEGDTDDDDDDELIITGLETKGATYGGPENSDTETPPAPPPPLPPVTQNPDHRHNFVNAAALDAEVIDDEDELVIRGDTATGK